MMSLLGKHKTPYFNSYVTCCQNVFPTSWPNQCPALSLHRRMPTAFCRFIHMENMPPFIAVVSDVGLSEDYL